MSWPDQERYLRSPQSLVVSLLLSLVFTLVFSRTGGVLSYLNSLTCRIPRFPPRNLCSLVMLAVYCLACTAMDTAICWALIYIGLAESRIFPAAPADTHSRTPFISFCTVQLRALCAAHSLATLCLSTTSGPGPGELPCFWGSMVFCLIAIPQKGSGNQHQQQHELNSSAILNKFWKVKCKIGIYAAKCDWSSPRDDFHNWRSIFKICLF